MDTTISAPQRTKPLVNIDSAILTVQEKSQLESLLMEFFEIFSTYSHNYGQTDLIEHNIMTGDATPIKLHAYRTSPTKQAIVQREINKLHQQGINAESYSPRSSPVILVQKDRL